MYEGTHEDNEHVRACVLALTWHWNCQIGPRRIAVSQSAPGHLWNLVSSEAAWDLLEALLQCQVSQGCGGLVVADALSWSWSSQLRTQVKTAGHSL